MRHKLDYARYQNRARGLDFEVGNKYLLRQLTSFPIRQTHQACLPKSPRKVESLKYWWKLKNEEVKDWFSQRIKDKDLNIWDSTRIYDSDRISGVTAVLRAHMGTSRGRYVEHSGKFSLSMKPRFNRPVGERNHFWRLMLAGFADGSREFIYGVCLGIALAPAATWNLHTTQLKYFAPTCSEVVNLTGLL
jgi:hypothetical protein